jgi:hypothetical protein
MSKQIYTKTWLLAALLAGVGTPAFAEMDCGAPIQKVGRDTGRNPVISVYVAREPNGTWHVNHRLADGTTIYRQDQYDMIDISQPGTFVWQGSNRRNPWIWMRGESKTVNGQNGYVESLYDARQGNKLVMYSEVQCGNPYKPYAAPPPQQSYIPPTTEAYVPPQTERYVPQPNSTAAGYGDDVVPFVMIGNAIHLSVVVGNTTTDMILDTGAEISSIPTALADSLIASGDAHELQPMRMRMADGSSHWERTVSVHKMSIGSHVRTNVSVSVSDGMTLLGLPVLNAIGKFTIDSANNRLIFG